MAKKKVSDKEMHKMINDVDEELNRRVAVRDEELAELKAKLAEHQAAIEGFRQSFANFDTKLKNLMERNRLR